MAIVIQLLVILIFSASSAYADVYKYTDDTGSICITNSLQNVPKKYRSSMTVVKEDTPAQKKLLPEVEKVTKDPAPVVQAVMPQNESQIQTFVAKPENRKKYINTGLVIAGIVAVYFILGRVSHIIGFQKVGTALFLLIVLTGGVYLYGLYIQELRAVFGTLRKDANNIKKNVETRDIKTDQMLKQLEEKESQQVGNESRDR